MCVSNGFALAKPLAGAATKPSMHGRRSFRTCRSGAGDGSEQIELALEQPSEVELLLDEHACAASKRSSETPVVKHSCDLLGERSGVVGRHKENSACGRELANTLDVACDSGYAGGHCLQQRFRVALAPRRKREAA